MVISSDFNLPKIISGCIYILKKIWKYRLTFYFNSRFLKQLFHKTFILHVQIRKKRMKKNKNLQLLVSAILVAGIALLYGLQPTGSLPILFDFNVVSTDLKHILGL